MTTLKSLEAKLNQLEIEIESLKDETMYLRSILADLIQSAVSQDAINPEFLIRKMADYRYSPLFWISKKEIDDIYQKQITILQEFADAIFLGLEAKTGSQKEQYEKLEETRVYFNRELEKYIRNS
ncbi:hypothetical protein [Neisseria sp. CCUG12390]|uniref:hypothetical protein n=1 Tax=Neisseria sp. CCUG12390 TaxID=3392035 RepID=UPI003A0FE7D0